MGRVCSASVPFFYLVESILKFTTYLCMQGVNPPFCVHIILNDCSFLTHDVCNDKPDASSHPQAA